jgi:hypothetical protein
MKLKHGIKTAPIHSSNIPNYLSFLIITIILAYFVALLLKNEIHIVSIKNILSSVLIFFQVGLQILAYIFQVLPVVISLSEQL